MTQDSSAVQVLDRAEISQIPQHEGVVLGNEYLLPDSPLRSNANLLTVLGTPDRVVFLNPTQTLSLKIAGAIVDVDDTSLENSGELVHDGPQGRFARALSEDLSRQLGIPHKFHEETWAPFRTCTGRAEIHVCELIAEMAGRAFGVTVDAAALMQRSRDIFKQNPTEFLAKVEVASGIRELLLSAEQFSIKSAICSASSEDFVHKAMEYFNLLKFFDASICSAAKKKGDNIFSGNPAKQACHAINRAPEVCCMFGDSLSDYATASLAGIPICVLRLTGDDREAALTSLFSKLRAWRQSQEQASGINPDTTLLIVDDFSQVKIIDRLRTENPLGGVSKAQFIVHD